MIIQSLLDNDLYKFTMMQAVLHQYPATWVKYKFKCRNYEELKKVLHPRFIYELQDEIKNLCYLEFTEEELDYLSTIPFFKVDFLEYLRMFKLQEKHVKVYTKTKEFKIDIEGPWLNTILFEIPILAIISEIHGKFSGYENSIKEGKKRLKEKLLLLKDLNFPFQFADFGTRRRHSYTFQRYVITTILHSCIENFVGTSNVHLAMKYDLKPIGTMAHEFLMAHQQLGRLVDSQKSALESWSKEYRGQLGIALSDVVGMDAFLRDFDLYFCKLFDGCRHDSGDPYEWTEKLLKHYDLMKIDPLTKTAVYSDGLDFPKAIELSRTYNGVINTSFGIGTSLTNDCGITPLQNVIKMIECNGKPVAKISDSPGKGMCEDQGYLDYLKSVYQIK